jgi:hypothetical protein
VPFSAGTRRRGTLGSFLQKPFTEEAISDELRRLIAAAQSR